MNAGKASGKAARVPGRSGSAGLWYALLGAPVAWFMALCAGYFLVVPACHLTNELPLHVVTAAAAAAAIGAGIAGRSLWRRSGGHWPDEAYGRRDRTRFLAAIGVALSTLFTLVILAQWAAVIILGPCTPRPRLPESPDAFLDTEAIPGWSSPRAESLRG